MEIPRNKLTARVHVAAVTVQQTKISSEKHPSFEGQVCFFSTGWKRGYCVTSRIRFLAHRTVIIVSGFFDLREDFDEA